MKTETVKLRPRASSLIESLRDIGYSFESAVADIIDNSITAKSQNIHLFFDYDEESKNIKFAIADDGMGMDYATLLEAMRPGSKNPLENRDKNDLGRFGLGLKTASFSQCRKLTVISKQKGKIHAARWDLDYVAEKEDWELLVLPESYLKNLYKIEFLHKTDSGTIVIWENNDRLVEDRSHMSKEYMYEKMRHLKSHLELVFHRFLSGKDKINMFINNKPLKPHDPFLTNHMATQILPEETIVLDGEKIYVQPYILPHFSKLSRQEYVQMEGSGGYLKNQGFYVYRNRRLLISGTWFRLVPQSELYKLARIRIDLPNDMDHLWKIDIKKSTASPPPAVKERLKKIIEKITNSSKRVYSARGHRSAGVPNAVWQREASRGEIKYVANRKHPLLANFYKSLGFRQKKLFSEVLDLLEESIPKDIIFNDMSERPKDIKNGETNDEDLENRVKEWIREGIIDNENAEILRHTEPFNKYTKSWEDFLKKYKESN